MILRPDFYEHAALDRAQARRELGIDPAALTGIVMFGGHGSAEMIRVARLLPDTPLILMCGHNERLARRLRAMPSRAPRVILGFTSDIQRWMRLGDFFIGKPGPGSISEALQCGLPVVVTRNRRTMPQERFNTDWVQQQGLGLVIQQYSQLPAVVHQLSSQLSALHGRVKAHRNNATREVTQLMAQLLDTAQAASGPPDPVVPVADTPLCVTSLT
jgi:UDP-N-acetylglucosamine:LPS N-acetylglucosamine transferase